MKTSDILVLEIDRHKTIYKEIYTFNLYIEQLNIQL